MVMVNSRGSHLLLELGSWQLGNLTRWWWVCLPDAVIWWGPIYWEMMLLFDCSECATLPSQCLRWPGCTPDSRSTQPTSSTQPGTFNKMLLSQTFPSVKESSKWIYQNIGRMDIGIHSPINVWSTSQVKLLTAANWLHLKRSFSWWEFWLSRKVWVRSKCWSWT